MKYGLNLILSDTERIYTEIFERIAKKYGKVYTWEMKVQLMGRPGKIGNEMAVKLMDLPITPEELFQEQQNLKKELFPLTNKLPGTVVGNIMYFLFAFDYFLTGQLRGTVSLNSTVESFPRNVET